MYCISTLLKNIINERPIKLIIIDSIAALFRSEFSFNESIARAEKLNKIGVCLKEYSANYGTVIVCTNQVINITRHNLGRIFLILIDSFFLYFSYRLVRI